MAVNNRLFLDVYRLVSATAIRPYSACVFYEYVTFYYIGKPSPSSFV